MFLLSKILKMKGGISGTVLVVWEGGKLLAYNPS
jgi:hypothetical protein